jgi:hypothetical protein
MVVITGSGRDWLLGEAASAGLPVIIEPSPPRSDRLAQQCTRAEAAGRAAASGQLRRGAHSLCQGRRSGPAGRTSQCRVADRAHVPWLPVSRIPVGPPPPRVCGHRAPPWPADGRGLVRGNRRRCRGDTPRARRSGAGKSGWRGSEPPVPPLPRRCSSREGGPALRWECLPGPPWSARWAG